MADDKKKKTKRPQALKRDIQNKKRREANRSFKSKISTAIRRLEESIQTKEPQTINTKLSTVYSLLDKGVKSGIFKLNTASRKKARLTAKALAVQA